MSLCDQAADPKAQSAGAEKIKDAHQIKCVCLSSQKKKSYYRDTTELFFFYCVYINPHVTFHVLFCKKHENKMILQCISVMFLGKSLREKGKRVIKKPEVTLCPAAASCSANLCRGRG